MNVVVLVGNLAADPELRKTSGGRAVCSFRIAVSRPGADAADFFTVVAWERQAEVCAQYLTTGRRVAVDGRLHQSTWEVEGVKRSRVEVVAHRVELLGRPRSADAPDDPFAAGAPAGDGTEQIATEVPDFVPA